MADDDSDETSSSSTSDAPPRPGFSSGLPQREEVPRPRTVPVARVAVALALLAFVVPTVLAVLDLAAIRDTLRIELVERAPDYSLDDIDRTLTVTLAAIGLVGALLSLLEVSAATSLARRGPGGRTSLVVLAILHLPVLVVTQAFRDVPQGMAWTVAQGVLLVIAASAAVAPRTRRWLRAKPPLAVKSLLRQQDDAAPRD